MIAVTMRYDKYRRETSMSTHLRPSSRWIGELVLALVGLIVGWAWCPTPALRLWNDDRHAVEEHREPIEERGTL